MMRQARSVAVLVSLVVGASVLGYSILGVSAPLDGDSGQTKETTPSASVDDASESAESMEEAGGAPSSTTHGQDNASDVSSPPTPSKAARRRIVDVKECVDSGDRLATESAVGDYLGMIAFKYIHTLANLSQNPMLAEEEQEKAIHVLTSDLELLTSTVSSKARKISWSFPGVIKNMRTSAWETLPPTAWNGSQATPIEKTADGKWGLRLARFHARSEGYAEIPIVFVYEFDRHDAKQGTGASEAEPFVGVAGIDIDKAYLQSLGSDVAIPIEASGVELRISKDLSKHIVASALKILRDEDIRKALQRPSESFMDEWAKGVASMLPIIEQMMPSEPILITFRLRGAHPSRGVISLKNRDTSTVGVVGRMTTEDLTTLARGGDGNAAFELGFRNFYGVRSVARSEEEARKWYQAAADAGSVRGQIAIDCLDAKATMASEPEEDRKVVATTVCSVTLTNAPLAMKFGPANDWLLILTEGQVVAVDATSGKTLIQNDWPYKTIRREMAQAVAKNGPITDEEAHKYEIECELLGDAFLKLQGPAPERSSSYGPAPVRNTRCYSLTSNWKDELPLDFVATDPTGHRYIITSRPPDTPETDLIGTSGVGTLKNFPGQRDGYSLERAHFRFTELGALIVHSETGGLICDAWDGSTVAEYGKYDDSRFREPGENFYASRDGRWVASAGVLWDALERKKERDFNRTITGDFEPVSITVRKKDILYADGQAFYTCVHEHIVSRVTKELFEKKAYGSSFSTTPDGNALLCYFSYRNSRRGSLGTIWAIAGHQCNVPLIEERIFMPGLLEGSIDKQVFASPVYSPNGEWGVQAIPIAHRTGVDSNAVLFDCHPSYTRHYFRLECASPLAISGDGKLLAATTSSGVTIWRIEVKTGKDALAESRDGDPDANAAGMESPQ